MVLAWVMGAAVMCCAAYVIGYVLAGWVEERAKRRERERGGPGLRIKRIK